MRWCTAGYEEGRRLKNVTRRLLSDAVQNSLPQFGLVPTYQNASVSPSLHPMNCTRCSVHEGAWHTSSLLGTLFTLILCFTCQSVQGVTEECCVAT